MNWILFAIWYVLTFLNEATFSGINLINFTWNLALLAVFLGGASLDFGQISLDGQKNRAIVVNCIMNDKRKAWIVLDPKKLDN